MPTRDTKTPSRPPRGTACACRCGRLPEHGGHDADCSLASRGPREAFDQTLAFFTGARTADGAPATFLLDEVLEFRTFENFPGLRTLMRDLLAALVGSNNRFVLTTRYVTRLLRLLRDAPPRLEVIQFPLLEEAELHEALVAAGMPDARDLARIV